MATKLTPTRHDFYQEEVDYRSALSEALLTKLGEGQQFITEKQLLHHEFKYLGPFRPIAGGEDGTLFPIFDYEIVGMSFRVRDAGSSGTTEIDIHKISTIGLDTGSILSTTAQITHASSDGAPNYKNLLVPSALASAGTTLPVFSSTEFSVGEQLRIDVVSNATGAKDLHVNIWYRAR